MLHSSGRRQLGIRISSIKVRLKLTGTELVPNPLMHPYLNYRSHPMDIRRLTLVLVIVSMHIPHMRQRETPQCTPHLSPLRPHKRLVAVVLKVKRSIPTTQDLWSTHS